jgi:hypothetical protein
MFTYTDLLMTNDSHPDLILNILFGITGGLLALVGLIAIFISINSQQNLERAKEILWNLQSFEIDFPDNNNNRSKKFGWFINHYNDLVKENYSIRKIINIAIASIIFVGISWPTFIIFLKDNLLTNELYMIAVFTIFADIILLMFILMLIGLKDITKLGGIPKNLTDNDPRILNDFYISIPYLFGLSLGIHLHNNKGIDIYTVTHIEVKNFYISIFGKDTYENIHLLKNKESTSKSIIRKYIRLQNATEFNLEEIDLIKDIEVSIIIQFQNNHVYELSYETRFKSEDLVYPYRVSLLTERTFNKIIEKRKHNN